MSEELTIHERHNTAASLAIGSGANVKAVQRMLGQASAAMTLDVYADLFDDDLDTVSVALNLARSKAILGGTRMKDASDESETPGSLEKWGRGGFTLAAPVGLEPGSSSHRRFANTPCGSKPLKRTRS